MLAQSRFNPFFTGNGYNEDARRKIKLINISTMKYDTMFLKTQPHNWYSSRLFDQVNPSLDKNQQIATNYQINLMTDVHWSQVMNEDGGFMQYWDRDSKDNLGKTFFDAFHTSYPSVTGTSTHSGVKYMTIWGYNRCFMKFVCENNLMSRYMKYTEQMHKMTEDEFVDFMTQKKKRSIFEAHKEKIKVEKGNKWKDHIQWNLEPDKLKELEVKEWNKIIGFPTDQARFQLVDETVLKYGDDPKDRTKNTYTHEIGEWLSDTNQGIRISHSFMGVVSNQLHNFFHVSSQELWKFDGVNIRVTKDVKDKSTSRDTLGSHTHQLLKQGRIKVWPLCNQQNGSTEVLAHSVIRQLEPVRILIWPKIRTKGSYKGMQAKISGLMTSSQCKQLSGSIDKLNDVQHRRLLAWWFNYEFKLGFKLKQFKTLLFECNQKILIGILTKKYKHTDPDPLKCFKIGGYIDLIKTQVRLMTVERIRGIVITLMEDEFGFPPGFIQYLRLRYPFKFNRVRGPGIFDDKSKRGPLNKKQFTKLLIQDITAIYMFIINGDVLNLLYTISEWIYRMEVQTQVDLESEISRDLNLLTPGHANPFISKKLLHSCFKTVNKIRFYTKHKWKSFENAYEMKRFGRELDLKHFQMIDDSNGLKKYNDLKKSNEDFLNAPYDNIRYFINKLEDRIRIDLNAPDETKLLNPKRDTILGNLLNPFELREFFYTSLKYFVQIIPRGEGQGIYNFIMNEHEFIRDHEYLLYQAIIKNEPKSSQLKKTTSRKKLQYPTSQESSDFFHKFKRQVFAHISINN